MSWVIWLVGLLLWGVLVTLSGICLGAVVVRAGQGANQAVIDVRQWIKAKLGRRSA